MLATAYPDPQPRRRAPALDPRLCFSARLFDALRKISDELNAESASATGARRSRARSGAEAREDRPACGWEDK